MPPTHTPQQRHIEAAKKVIHAFMDDPSAISIRGILTPMIALALAEAENRAAWAGFVAGGPRGVAAYWGNNDNAKEHDEAFEALFGPRPAKENPHA